MLNEHETLCNTCGETFDMRNLTQVFSHETCQPKNQNVVDLGRYRLQRRIEQRETTLADMAEVWPGVADQIRTYMVNNGLVPPDANLEDISYRVDSFKFGEAQGRSVSAKSWKGTSEPVDQ